MHTDQCLSKMSFPRSRRSGPSSSRKTIYLQHDNAKPHASTWDATIESVCQSHGWDIQIVSQPPNSPDCNVLDLGFFRSLQTLQLKRNSRCIDDVIAATLSAWCYVKWETLNCNFITLQCCLQEIIRSHGENDYKVPHINKCNLSRTGCLPDSIACDTALFDSGCSLLASCDFDAVLDELSKGIAR